MTTVDVLRMIVSRSPLASERAAKAIVMTDARRYKLMIEETVRLAIDDSDANWSPEERSTILDLYDNEKIAKTRMIRVRVNAHEMDQMKRIAEDNNTTMSEYIRKRVGLQ